MKGSEAKGDDIAQSEEGVNHDRVGATERQMKSPEDRDSTMLKVQFDEVQEDEVLEKFEKRFGKSLPLESINVLLLMDNTIFEEMQELPEH